MDIKKILNNNSKKWDTIPTWLLVEMAAQKRTNDGNLTFDGDNQRLVNWQVDGSGEQQARATALRILTIG
jgi:hypothetical protein